MDWVGFATTWVKALHVISVIAWIAGMMYLPRLFVYHAAATDQTSLASYILGAGFRFS